MLDVSLDGNLEEQRAQRAWSARNARGQNLIVDSKSGARLSIEREWRRESELSSDGAETSDPVRAGKQLGRALDCRHAPSVADVPAGPSITSMQRYAKGFIRANTLQTEDYRLRADCWWLLAPGMIEWYSYQPEAISGKAISTKRVV